MEKKVGSKDKDFVAIVSAHDHMTIVQEMVIAYEVPLDLMTMYCDGVHAEVREISLIFSS